MKGDFTRSTFQPKKHYSSVRMQQGRLQLDADWNEQADIQTHQLQTHTQDMIGAIGVPDAQNGFKLAPTPDSLDLAIAPGHLYIDGILCELELGTPLDFKHSETNVLNQLVVSTLTVDGQPFAEGQWLEILVKGDTTLISQGQVKITNVDATPRQSRFTLTVSSDVAKEGFLRRIPVFSMQPDYPILSNRSHPERLNGTYIAYLDVWQRHITAIEDPTIREVALNLPDTTTRTKTVWQIKLATQPEWDAQQIPRQATLKARLNPAVGTGENSSTRRLDNQLYRVEIHGAGGVGTATFKWSRENGAIVSSLDVIADNNGNFVTLATSSRDLSQSFAPNQWVEITDDAHELHGLPGTLVHLTNETSGKKLVFRKAKDSDEVSPAEFPKEQRPKVRRWDQTVSAEILTALDQWILLENGIEIGFNQDSVYQTGDYWLIPARTVTNNIEWSRDSLNNPLSQAIAGIEHHYCPLATIKLEDGQFSELNDLRPTFSPLVDCLSKAGGTITGSLTIEKSLTVNGATIDASGTQTRFQTKQQGYTFDKPITLESGLVRSSANQALLLQTDNTNRIVIENGTGNIGIGIEKPTATLQIASSITQTPALRISADEDHFDVAIQKDQSVQFQTSTSGYVFDKTLTVDTGKISSGHDRDLSLQTANVDRVTVLKGTGNVGIGIDAPTAKLHINTPIDQPQAFRISTRDRAVEIGVPNDDRVQFQTTCQSYVFDKGIILESGSINVGDRAFSLQTENTNRITILNTSGNTGIGTDTPAAKLHIAATNQSQALRVSTDIHTIDLGIQPDQKVHFQTTCQGYTFDKRIFLESGLLGSFGERNLALQTANTNRVMILGNGNVGIGTNAPETKLHIEGDVKIDGELTHNGNAQVSSSRQLKDNIARLSSQDVADLLKALTPVTFTRKSDQTQRLQAGFIAEEVPDLVASHDRTAIRPMEILAILTKSVQDNQHTILTLAQQIEAQQSDLTMLNQKVKRLEAKSSTHRKSKFLINPFLKGSRFIKSLFASKR